MNISQAFLIFSIGPVQSFIAQARRAQDLYAGSRFLSRLMSAALDVIEGAQGEVLYPLRPSRDVSLPNKVVALLPEPHADAIAREAEQVVRDTWRQMADDAGRALERYESVDGFWAALWDEHIRQLPEVYWNVYPIPAGQDLSPDYRTISTTAQRGFEARKRLRGFGQVKERESKCTMCGLRAALHRRGEGARDYWKSVANRPWVTGAQLRPDGRERLCAVCATKRFGGLVEAAFPSVSHVATAGFKARLLKDMASDRFSPELLELFGALARHHSVLKQLGLRQVRQDLFPHLYQDLLPGVNPMWQTEAKGLLSYDGDVLFPETFTPRRLRDSYGQEITPAKAAEGREATAALLRAAKAAGITLHSPYYAILMLDGDRMGKQLAAVQAKERHKEISQALARFADEVVSHIVEREHPGQAVYAGGDDVLALVPVEHALPAAAALSRAYNRAMQGFLPEPHVSAGIAIAHHLYPLEAALTAARSAEGAAKDTYDHNALAAHFLKRSGERVQVGAGWSLEDGTDTIDLLETVGGHFASRRLSMGFAHALLSEARTLAMLPSDARRAELRRLLIRQAGQGLSPEKKRQQAQELAPDLEALATSIDKRKAEARARRQGSAEGDDEDLAGMVELAHWLQLMRFLAQGGGEA
jgi:CRISPR-associated protein Cmr2